MNLQLADGTPVTNTNRDQYLTEALSSELIDSRKPSLDKVCVSLVVNLILVELIVVVVVIISQKQVAWRILFSCRC